MFSDPRIPRHTVTEIGEVNLPLVKRIRYRDYIGYYYADGDNKSILYVQHDKFAVNDTDLIIE